MNMKKKLLVTASTFPRWENDTEPRFILDYAKSMKKYYDVTVLVPAAKGAKEKEVLEGVKVIRYHYFPVHKWETLCYPGAIVPRIKEKKIRVLLVPFLFLGLWVRLFRMLSKYDVIHAHWLIPQGIVQSFFKKPYIVTGHGGDVTSMNKGIVKFLKINCLKKAKSITVVSEALKQQIVNTYPAKNVEVISMGCDISKFGKQYRVENYFNQGNRKVILFVGRLVEVKGVTYLIEAMRQVDAKLIIVGDGPLKEKLMHQALDLKDRIEFWGAKTHEELPVIYASADVFVAPSITAKNGDKEGLGLVLLEAMASGVPVVASRSGGIIDVVKDGENGLLAEEKNSEELAYRINQLLTDEVLYSQIRRNAFLTAKQYDYRLIAKRYSKIIDKVWK